MSEMQKFDIQLFYARVIDRAAKLGFLLLLLTFSIYMGGILTPYVPLEDLPQYWSRPASLYLEANRIQTGWGWVAELHHGDMLNFFPIAILAGVTIFGYLCLVCKLLRNREVILGMIVIFQVMVLILAASGILRTGGH
ncbi:MAG: hypothetical protein Q8M54_07455 [Desulfobaccales bacterium]|nr:hypothetical protein [Desulfobaccales bacterium]